MLSDEEFAEEIFSTMVLCHRSYRPIDSLSKPCLHNLATRHYANIVPVDSDRMASADRRVRNWDLSVPLSHLKKFSLVGDPIFILRKGGEEPIALITWAIDRETEVGPSEPVVALYQVTGLVNIGFLRPTVIRIEGKHLILSTK
jgi:hypothetical protein